MQTLKFRTDPKLQEIFLDSAVIWANTWPGFQRKLLTASYFIWVSSDQLRG